MDPSSRSRRADPPKLSVFEPPQIQVASLRPTHWPYPSLPSDMPIGSILAAQMLLAYLGEVDGAALVEESVAGLFATGKLRSAGTDSGVGTREQGEWVRDLIRQRSASPK